ncbi:MAG: L-erythro-3,5-diaminohexanoate dehydrogenase [Firmicutes bacterium]|nr:L-erythro-3,5-diaminohexanoate dehydrogenase [Bacillota bacterium]
MGVGCPYGSHRVLEPAGVLPQAAWRLDNRPEILDNEALLDVERLNVDAASFTQIKEACHGDPDRMAEHILDIVRQRGKLHNPVTGSGGMLIGTVRQVGPALADRRDRPPLRAGDRIATLVSLSLTPLHLEAIEEIDLDRDQVRVKGHAVLFASGTYAHLPADMPPEMALAILDVAGAPAQTARLVQPGHKVFIVGAGGKSGLLCAAEARKRAGRSGEVVGLCHSPASAARLRRLGAADHVLTGDATRPLEVLAALEKAAPDWRADVTINCVNIAGTEMTSILATRSRGVVYFFGMATSFTAAALGAEGVGHDVDMLIGNGYATGHAEAALATVRENPVLYAMFHELYGSQP